MPNHRISRLAILTAVPLLGGVLSACDMDWGGAEFSVDRPPAPEDTTSRPDTAGVEMPEVPDGPLLYRVVTDAAGRARVSPVARVRGRGLDTLHLPDQAPEAWWARFDSTFLPRGRELELHAGGGRAGSLLLTGTAAGSGPRCPGAAEGRILLPPGRPVPGVAFALPRGLGTGRLVPADAVSGPGSPTSRQEVFGPILAERLLQEAGVERHFLARNVDLRSVSLGDTVPGMAATYLIGDSLAAGPPSGDAVSLFFLARLANDGYTPVWSRVARYGDADSKEAYRHVESIQVGGGRLDLLRRYGGTGSQLVAAWAPEDGDGRSIRWSESARCPVRSPGSGQDVTSTSGGEAP